MPESPRFLIAKDRHEEALQILIKYHAEGDAASPLIAAQYEQIRHTIRMEKEATQFPLKDLFSTKTNLRRVAIAVCVGLFAQWSGNGLVSYYLARVLASIGITERRTQNQINLGLMSWNLITGIAGSFVQHFARRRVQFLTSYAGMTIMFASWTAASAVFAQNSDNGAASRAVVALIFIYYAFYNLMMPLAYLFITEVFPYMQRSKGMAIMLLASRAGGFTNTFVNPIGLANIGWRFYVSFPHSFPLSIPPLLAPFHPCKRSSRLTIRNLESDRNTARLRRLAGHRNHNHLLSVPRNPRRVPRRSRHRPGKRQVQGRDGRRSGLDAEQESTGGRRKRVEGLKILIKDVPAFVSKQWQKQRPGGNGYCLELGLMSASLGNRIRYPGSAIRLAVKRLLPQAPTSKVHRGEMIGCTEYCIVYCLFCQRVPGSFCSLPLTLSM